jgi:hypothetical protein
VSSCWYQVKFQRLIRKSQLSTSSDLVPGRGKRISYFPQRPDRLWGPQPSSHLINTRSFIPGSKAAVAWS